MRKTEPTLFEYLLVLALFSVVIYVLWAIVGDAFSPSHSISGQIVKTYIVGHQYTTASYASVQQSDGDLVTIEMSLQDYGSILQGDTCSFEVSAKNYVRSMKCRREAK